MAKKKGGKKKSGMQKGKLKEPVQKSIISKFLPRVIIILVLILAVFLLLRNGDTGNKAEDMLTGEDYAGKPKPMVTLEMETGALIKMELDPVSAPNTVKNFIALAEAGFYDGLIFHRVIPGFMIQGGCPEGTGFGGPGYAIRGEFSENDHGNELVHERGVISMARSRLPDTAGSQFFITAAKRPDLDGKYAVFGTVLEGMEEVDRIVAVPTDENDKPLEEERIRQVRVEKFGVEYGPPQKM
jgi:peptidyl-prolyl cis-trans isomerase B (cyclophilin B)